MGTQQFVLALANNLVYDGEKVSLGAHTRYTLDKAVRVFHSLGGACGNVKLLVTAGWSPAYQVVMCRLMVDYLIAKGMRQRDVLVQEAECFDTNGEMTAAVSALDAYFRDQYPAEAFEIHVVTRWHHLPRSWLLLRARLGVRKLWANILLHPSWSLKLHMVAYELLAAVKNVPNFRGAFAYR